jgi:hypothetical protein
VRRPPVNRDLFGEPPTPPRDRTPVTLGLQFVDQSEKAWLLRASGRRGVTAWAPKSEVTRGEGPRAGEFTMPRWIARERGWL